MRLRHPSSKQVSTHSKKRVVFWPRRIRPRITTLIIGSESLVSDECGSLTLLPCGRVTTDSLRESMTHALQESPRSHYRQLLAELPPASRQPAAHYDHTITGTAWHQGDHYVLHWVGPPEAMIQHSDLTDNEREQLLAKARSLAVAGSIIYAVGQSSLPHTSSTHLASIQPSEIRIDGLVAHTVQLQPGVVKALQFCAREGIRVIYASTDPMLTTTAIATRAHLLAKEALPTRVLPNMKPTVAPVYTSLSGRVKRQIINSFDPDSTLVTDEPLAEIVRTITVR